ncbi:BAG_1a_G0041400.mRNA.1.CDS.1 [Saccharomyces cerevisiae]|nr:SX2_G0024430.mRNA.1.CDS.1 [Saccharomyces cerevisiae]CAI4666755.1 BAG_1a_G0041400.mRNA.1.CDS.1 [Saccharomyces cerevisiae]CAI7254405.1 BAG_1a_G0041400.mRNA.1.CDS.1 [Saccharomyces cerevisiae]
MFNRTTQLKSKHPCSVCSRRKVKCDRMIPCGNCRKRGQDPECMKSAKLITASSSKEYLPDLLLFWQNYEYWITNIGLYKTKQRDLTRTPAKLDTDTGECMFWMNYLQKDQSFQLMNFAMENLGALYFGSIGDISELYLRVEQYWDRRADKNHSVDGKYWDALIWSVFTMCIYYMPVEKLAEIFSVYPLHEYLGSNKRLNWEDGMQLVMCQNFARCSLFQLKQCDFMAHPDIRLVQAYLILATTTFPYDEPLLANSLLTQCIHTFKNFHVDDFRPLLNDDPVESIAKVTLGRIFYRLCGCDYLQSGPRKPIALHTEVSSLLQHAAYLQDLPNVDVYREENSTEVLYWKIISLDRDLDQYLNKSSKPPLKTLDAIRRELDIFQYKVDSLEEDFRSNNSRFQKFIALFQISTVSWKLFKMYLIYYDTADSLLKVIHYSKVIISLIVNNFHAKSEFFNRHPMVMQTITRVVSFISFYQIFVESAAVKELLVDLTELTANLPTIFGSKLDKLGYLTERLSKLKLLWDKVQLLDSGDSFYHPVFKILQNDIKIIELKNDEMFSLIKGLGSLVPLNKLRQESLLEEEDENNTEPSDFRTIVEEFQSEYNISDILS